MQARTDAQSARGARGQGRRPGNDAHLLSDNTVVIFSLSKGCSACRRVKSYFEDEGIPYYALELDQHSDDDTLKAALAERTEAAKRRLCTSVGTWSEAASDVSRACNLASSHWTDDPDAVAPPRDKRATPLWSATRCD